MSTVLTYQILAPDIMPGDFVYLNSGRWKCVEADKDMNKMKEAVGVVDDNYDIVVSGEAEAKLTTILPGTCSYCGRPLTVAEQYTNSDATPLCFDCFKEYRKSDIYTIKEDVKPEGYDIEINERIAKARLATDTTMVIDNDALVAGSDGMVLTSGVGSAKWAPVESSFPEAPKGYKYNLVPDDAPEDKQKAKKDYKRKLNLK